VPATEEILRQLARATNELGALAIVWHVLVLVAALAMLSGRIPSRYLTTLAIGLVLSVVIVSLGYGNWFNGVSFLVLAVALTMSATDGGVALEMRPWQSLLGTALVVFGFIYSHFVEGAWYRPLYAAPIGVLPCPTLAMIAGYVLLTGAGGMRSVPVLLAIWTAFYAIFGIVKLGVFLDIGLVAATLGLVALAIQNVHARKSSLAHAVT